MLTNDISTRRLQYEIEAKYHTVGTFPKTNRKIVERGKMLTNAISTIRLQYEF